MKIGSDLNLLNVTSNVYSPYKIDKSLGQNPIANNSSIFNFTGKQSNSYTKSVNKAAELRASLKKVKDEQGLIGKAWDGIKGLFGNGSKKIEKQIEKFEKGEISYEEVQKSIDSYKDGQKMSVDVVGDLASGIISVMAFAFAVPTGGASLIAGAALAAGVGAGVKIGVKALDAKIGGREYSSKDFWYDTATGAINGLLAPITNGIGACVTKSIGQKLGLTVVKEGTEEIIEQGAKASLRSLIASQGVKVSGGSLASRAVATAAGMAVDGSLGGAADNAVRAVMNGENVIKAAAEGAVGGLIMAPVIGGGFKVAGKIGHSINRSLTVNSVLPDAANITFGQGIIGDCALLSTLDGMLHNPQTLQKIQKSITQSIDGSYNVTIGGRTVKVLRDALTDEMLSDKTGIRIFEQAYKQIAGELDGGFADVVAKQFGLNPVHINSVSITDETLDLLAKEKNNGIFSFGTKIDANGNIALDGTNHYLSIRDIDPLTKKVVVADPYNTAKTIELSYDDVKKMAISIDGGTIKTSETLPHYVRKPGDLPFYGYEIDGRFVYVDKLNGEDLNYLLNHLISNENSFYIDADGVLRLAPNADAASMALSERLDPIRVSIIRAQDAESSAMPIKLLLDDYVTKLKAKDDVFKYFSPSKMKIIYDKFYDQKTGRLIATPADVLALMPNLSKCGLDEDSISKVLKEMDSSDVYKLVNDGLEAEKVIKQARADLSKAEGSLKNAEYEILKDEAKHSQVYQEGDEWVFRSELNDPKTGKLTISESVRITNEEYLQIKSLLANPKYKKLIGDMDNIHAIHRLIQRYGLPKDASVGTKVDFNRITSLLDSISDVMENPNKYELLVRNTDGTMHFPALGFHITRNKTSRNACALMFATDTPGIYDAIILNKDGRIVSTISDVKQSAIDNSFCQILENKVTKVNDIAKISDDDVYDLIKGM